MSSPVGYPQGNSLKMFTDGTYGAGDIPVGVTDKKLVPLYATLSDGGGVLPGVGISFPSNFSFDFSRLAGPLLAVLSPDGTVAWDYNYKAHIPAGCKSAPLSQIFHVSPSGADGASGIGAYVGDFATAKASVFAAINAGNATGLPYQIIVKSGTYLRTKTAQSTAPTQDVWVRGWNDGIPSKRPVMLMADDLTWALDATYTTLYKAARTNVIWALDLLNKRPDGSYEPFVKYATAAAANSATGNAYFNDGTNVYIKRADGAAPTIANTACTMTSKQWTMSAASGHVYIENVVFVGGGANEFKLAPTKDVVAVDCDFLNIGGYANVANGATVLGVRNFIAVRCNASGNSSDGWNAHVESGNYPQMLTLGCTSYNNGDGTIGSCNGWTIHDGVKGIDVAGRYGLSHGAQVVPVNAGSQALCIGTVAEWAKASGVNPPNNFFSSDSAQMWMLYTRGANADTDISASVSGEIYVKGHVSTGCRVERAAISGATISDF